MTQSIDNQTDSSMQLTIVTSALPSKLITDYFDARYQNVDGTMLLARANQTCVSMKISDNESRLI